MRNILLLSLSLFSIQLYSQSVMSVEECIRVAWKQNPSMRNSVIGVKEAKVDYVASIGKFLPRIDASAQAGRNWGRSIDPATNAYTTETFDEGTVGLDMTLSLFEGFSRINQVRFQKINCERSEWERKNKENNLAYQVADAYYKILLEQKMLALAVEQSRLSERYLRQTETFVELGLKSASDLQEVKARREGDIYRCQSRENSHRLAVVHLKQLMNVQAGDTILLQDNIQEEQLPFVLMPQIENLFTRSQQVLPSMRIVELKQQAARKEYAVAGGSFSPSIYARFSVGSNYYNTLFSSKQLKDHVGKYFGLGISFPLLSNLERLTNQRKLKLNIYRMKNEAEIEKQQLYTDIEQTLLSLRAGYDEHRQALSQVKAETLVLKESERKWEEGLISVFQLMEARNRFISAKAELTRVRLQVEILIMLERYYIEGSFI